MNVGDLLIRFCFFRKPALLPQSKQRGRRGLSIAIELGPRGRAVSLMRPARREEARSERESETPANASPVQRGASFAR